MMMMMMMMIQDLSSNSDWSGLWSVGVTKGIQNGHIFTTFRLIISMFFGLFLTLKEELAALRIADIMRMVGVRSHCERKKDI